MGGGLREAAHAFWFRSDLPELFPEFLIVDYSISRASTPLMEAAHAAARSLSGADPVAACLADYLETHIREELHHDEWLLEDLEALGQTRESVLQRLPSSVVAGFVGAQYYWIHHAHPVSLLGYLAVLEGEPPSPEFLKNVIASTGLPAAAFRTFLEHAYLDVHHEAELYELLDAMPLTEQQSALIGISAVQTVDGLRRAFESLLELRPQAVTGGIRKASGSA